VLTATVLELLGNGAQLAIETIDKHKPTMSADRYVSMQRGRFSTETFGP
jgi:hypothetical protein